MPRYVILGGGAVTAEYYLPALRVLGHSAETVVVDPSERSLADLKAAFPEIAVSQLSHQVYLQSLPEGAEDRVVVALPNALHVEAVGQALDLGRHVLCEKPLALRSQDCRALTEQAQRSGRLLKVAMSRRYLPTWMLARQMVKSGELGALTAIEVRDCHPFAWRPRSFAFFAPESGGVLADMGVHYLDFLDLLAGPMTPLAFTSDSRGGAESNAHLQMRAGATAIDLHLSRLDPGGAFIRIRGERGEIVIDKGDETEIVFTPSSGTGRSMRLAQPFDSSDWPQKFHGAFCQMLADFEASIAGQVTPIADAADAERAAGLIEWTYRQRPAPSVAEAPPVLVTGGTGFIGGQLIDRLCGRGQAVRATVRSPRSMANLARYPVDIRPADLLDPEAMRAAVRGCKTVYHLAYGQDKDARRVTVEGAKSVVEAAIAEGVECVVLLSTMYVFGFPPGEGPVDESFPNRPYGGEYGTSKAEMEAWALERAKTSGGTRIVVLNPTCVYGPRGVAYTTLPVDLAKEDAFCWIEDGRGSCNHVYVENLIDAIELAVTCEQAHGQRFIINDGETTWRQFFTPFLAPLNRAIPAYSMEELRRLPRFGPPFHWRDLARAVVSSERVRNVAKRSPMARRLFAQVGEHAERQGGGDHALTYRPTPAEPPAEVFPPLWLTDLFGPARARFSSEKARRILGWSPRLNLDQAQAETLDWLRQTHRLP